MLRSVSVGGATPTLTYYFGPFVHEGLQGGTSSLKYIITPEGRIVNSGTDLSPVWSWEYNLTDHLGNVRAVIAPTATAGNSTLLQQTHYYPFGMRMSQISTSASSTNDYLYNGKQLQSNFNLNWYDYGARFYDPALGRWHCVDPDAQSYFAYGPYVYVGNNPIRRIDPDGNNGWDVVLGFGAALVDNACGGFSNIRAEAANHVTDASDFNSGLNSGDVASIALGGAEVIGGGNMAEGGTAAVAVGVVGLTAGGAGVVPIAAGAATAATGTAIAAHGTMMMTSATKNLSEQKGRLQEGNANSEKPAESSNSARKEAMRKEGIPTSQQPDSQSKNASGREYRYGDKSVQQQTKDSNHGPHWEAGTVKKDPRTGEVRNNEYGRPKLENDKSKVYYEIKQ